MATSRIKHGGKVFRDPVHRLIRIDRDDEFILDLIDTPEFQRLRRIRQLGVSWLTFHGAEHSRFVHSLGVFNFAQRIVESLQRRYAGSAVADYLKKNARVVKAAALLHDIGHGPFSHMIERAFSVSGQHEKKTVAVIRDHDSSVGGVLVRYGVDAEQVARLIDHTSEHPLLVDIVSSQLDADRMDYLLRDSYCTGVQYGLYDAEWILNALCVGRDRATAGEGTPAWRLCLDRRRGEKAAEQFVLARAHMNEQVYFHRVTRGYEAMLLALFAQAERLAQRDQLPPGTPPLVVEFFGKHGELDGDAWLQFDEPQLVVALHGWSRATGEDYANIARWSRAFLCRERLLTSVPLGALSASILRLEPALVGAGLKEGVDWHVDDASSTQYKGILTLAAKGADLEEERLESILLASGRPDDVAIPIESSSELFRSLDHKKQSLARLYIDKARREAAKPVLEQFKLKSESDGDDL
ncbi:MAG: HD domain-containing protein [Phycisphaerales bacterium]